MNQQTVLVEVLNSALASCKVGVLVKGLTDIVPGQVLAETQDGKNLSVVAVGYTPSEYGDLLSANIEDAVKWRNDPTRAGKIVAFVSGESDKQHSLREFDVITERTLSEHLVVNLAGQKEDNLPTRSFWEALQKSVVIFSFERLVEFVDEVRKQGKSTTAIPENLWRLGLLRDEQILGAKIDPVKRLKQNHKLIADIGQLSEENRRRLANSLSRADAAQNQRYQDSYRTLQMFFKYGKLETLKNLDFETVQKLLSVAKEKSAKTPPAGGPGNDEDEHKAADRPVGRKEFDEIVADGIVSPDNENPGILDDVVEHLKKRFENPLDGTEEKNVGGAFGGRPVVFDRFDTPLRKLVGVYCTEENWGGVMSTEEKNLRDAIDTSATAKKDFFTPLSGLSHVSFDGAPIFELLQRFDEYFRKNGVDSADAFGPIIEKLLENRKKLLDDLDFILFYPVLGFGSGGELQTGLFGYVEAWAELLQTYCRNNTAMHRASPQGARAAARALLTLDVLFVETPTEWKGMLMPLHPLHLWRYYEVFKSLVNRATWEEKDADRLKQVLNALPQVLNFLVLDGAITGSDVAIELPCSGACETLPTFENKTNRYLGSDGVDAVLEVLSRWLAFAPHSARDLRLCTVDAPDHIAIIRSLGKLFNRAEPCRRIVYTLFLTRDQNGNREIAQLDYDQKDCDIGDLIRSGQLEISVRNVKSLADVRAGLEQRPVHVAFYFDQSFYDIEHGPVNRQLYITPLVVTYDYEYDSMRRRGNIFPSTDTESGVIGDYHKLMRLADVVSTNQMPRATYCVDADTTGITSTIADGLTQWLVAADRTMSNYVPRETLPIGEKRYDRRMVGIWASRNSRVIDQYETLLRKYNLYPDSNTLRDVFIEFGHISADGLVSIPPSGSADANENRRKGLIGTVFAAKWFTRQNPGSLVASLDSPDARLWLHSVPKDAGRSGTERADLIGLCHNEATDVLRIIPIEVKTREQSPEAEVEIRASNHPLLKGHAADQIATVIRLLREIFEKTDDSQPDMFTAARREVLKLQIVSECFRDRADYEWQEKWDTLFKRLFSKDVEQAIKVELRGMLIHVKLGAILKGQSVECRHADDPSCIIDFIELTSGDIQSAIFEGDSPLPIDLDDTKAGDFQGDDDTIHESSPDASPTTIPSAELHTPAANSESLHTRNLLPHGVEGDLRRLIRDFRHSCSERGIHIEECDAERAVIGPVIVRFPFKLARGQKRQVIANQLDDIGREMRRTGVMIQPIRNSDELYLDVPRLTRDIVLFADVIGKLAAISSPDQLPFVLGRTPDGRDLIEDLAQCPHLLVGGSTGSGKTVFLWTLLLSLLRTHPSKNDLQILLSSSGLVDFVHFENLPHLVSGKVFTDVAETTRQIKEVVFQEFNRRNDLLVKARVSNIQDYNNGQKTKLAPLVVIIDEFADLTDQLGSKKEKDAFFTPVQRIAQYGRKLGIHLVLCTQRPAAVLVPSNIKAQLNARLALRVNDYQSSKMILDDTGAQYLQKHGDMLFKSSADTERAQGYFVDAETIQKWVVGDGKFRWP